MNRLLVASAALALFGAAPSLAQPVTPPTTPSWPSAPPATDPTTTPPATMPTPATPSTPSETPSNPMPPTEPGQPAPDTTSPPSAPSIPPSSESAHSSDINAAATPGESKLTETASATTDTSDQAGGMVGDLAQSNPPPAKYPACTSRKQDRCMVMAQVKRHAVMAQTKRKVATTTPSA
jgi:hypothetical protein